MVDVARTPASEAVDAAALAAEVLTAARGELGTEPASLRARLRNAGAGEDGIEGLLASLRESQSANARLRRRAAELEALYSTARELVRLRDADEVLQRLVERAHELIGTDVTYLSEVESGTGELRVRHSVGTVTPGFRDLRVPAGYGLASLVARTREPAWIARYSDMRDAPHDPHIDRAVAAEGLVSFLGVPLAVGDEVLGALFACNRFVHESSPEDILLLSAFADHAAAVLHSARLLAESEAATARAEAANRALEEHLAAAELAAAVHEELTTAVMSGGSVDDIVATLARSLDRPVSALDEGGRALRADASKRGGDVPPRSAVAAALAESATSGHVAEVVWSDRVWWVISIPGADRVTGGIVTERIDRSGDHTARRTLERAAHVAALVSFQQDAVTAIRAERRSRWLLALLDGRVPDDALSPAPTSFTGCTVIGVGEARAASAAATTMRVIGEAGVVTHRDDRVIVAWTTADDVREASERVRGTLAVTLGLPDATAVVLVRDIAPSDVSPAVERATADARFLPAIGVQGATVRSDTLAPYHALSAGDPETVDRFIGDLVGRVTAWDAHRGTELFDTLAAYFDEGENRSAVASALHVHKNTVQQRLERVQALLDGDLTDAEYRFRVQAAVRLERLRRTLRTAARS